MKPEDKVKQIVKENQDVWKTESAFMSYVRGGIRRGLWNKHPLKLKLINKKRFQIPNPNPRGNKPTVWGGKCDLCGNLHVSAKMQVDHIKEKGSSLKEISDIQSFIEDMVIITESDLRWICIDCHSIVSYQQKMGIPFEQAKKQKEFILISKSSELVIDTLKTYGVPLPSTQKARKELLKELMLGETIE